MPIPNCTCETCVSERQRGTPYRAQTPAARANQARANYARHLMGASEALRAAQVEHLRRVAELFRAMRGSHIVAPAVLKYNAPISAQIFRAHDVARATKRQAK
jgi:hypothetical protein